ncbi:MAG: purine-nucleoside phosphorylase [Planctomycetaceae bacterium]|nr:purine-nucleoside phosphorylase [Planctomycetaceae bacterium]
MTSLSTVEATAEIIRSAWPKQPRAAVILGTGLGGLASHIEVEATFAYKDLPEFPTPTAIAHKGQFVCGALASVPIIALQGRVHYYEGFDFDQITLPVRVAGALGSKLLIVSNASGGVNPQYRSGDIMVLDDHIDLMGKRNLRGGISIGSGDRPASRPVYDSDLAGIATEIGRRDNFGCHRGVYVAVTGPNYETRAEYRFMRRIGGDVVGMSTIPEVIAAHGAGMRVLALSAVTNIATPDAPDLVDALEVVDIAEHAEPKLRSMVIGVLEKACSRQASDL